MKIEECPRLTIQKNKILVHHSYHACLSIVMDRWLVISIVSTVLVLQYIIGSLKRGFIEGTCLLAALQEFRKCINGDFTGFDLPKYLIYYRVTYSIQWSFSVVGLVLFPLKNDARMIARYYDA